MEKVVFDAKWIKVKQTPKGYFFSERKGTDSVAVLLYRQVEFSNIIEVLVRMQPLPVENAQTNDDADIPKLFQCPITGGMEEGYMPLQIAIKECEEEAGYILNEQVVRSIGKYYVGTQTNEVVHMYIANVTSFAPRDIKGDGTYFESISKNVWMNLNMVLNADYSGLNIIANKLQRMYV